MGGVGENKTNKNLNDFHEIGSKFSGQLEGFHYFIYKRTVNVIIIRAYLMRCETLYGGQRFLSENSSRESGGNSISKRLNNRKRKLANYFRI